MFRFGRQMVLAYFLGVAANVDMLLVAQIVPMIILATLGGGGGEVLVTMIRKSEIKDSLVSAFMGLLIAFVCLIGLAAYILFPRVVAFYEITPEAVTTFSILSALFFANLIPGVIVSVSIPLVYLQNKYWQYAVAIISSEFLALVAIISLVDTYGIIAFPIGTLCGSIINMFLFVRILRLKPKILSIPQRLWSNREDIGQLLRRLFYVSGQTIVFHLAAFWDRSLSIKFLEPGYLSRLNYSQTVFELPKTIFQKSIGTTTYIRQIQHTSDADGKYRQYTEKMTRFLFATVGIAQLFFVFACPMLLILLYRRGKFGNDEVVSTLVIMEILALSLFPAIMDAFLSRSLYAQQEFRIVFWSILSRVLLKLVLMFSLINALPHVVPISTVVGLYFGYFFSQGLAARKGLARFFTLGQMSWMVAILILGIAMAILNGNILDFYLGQTWYILAFLLISVTAFLGVLTGLYLKKTGHLKALA